MFFFQRAQADCGCEQIELLEKSSTKNLQQIGLITNPIVLEKFISEHGLSHEPGKIYNVYISKIHVNGAGHYKIDNIAINGKQIVLSLEFFTDPFEASAAVMNHRILFFKTSEHCKVIKVLNDAK